MLGKTRHAWVAVAAKDLRDGPAGPRAYRDVAEAGKAADG